MKKAKQTDRIATTIVPNGRYGAPSSGISRWIERSPPLANWSAGSGEDVNGARKCVYVIPARKRRSYRETQENCDN